MARLGVYQGPSDLYVVPFGELQQGIVRQAPAPPRIVLYRRFMLRIADAVARAQCGPRARHRRQPGTGASQTLGNLDTINRAARLPVLRPLIGMDKLQIVERAREIGTFEISIEADQDCCSFLQPAQSRYVDPTGGAGRSGSQARLSALLESTLERVERERIEPNP